MANVSIRGVHKRFGPVEVLRDINLDIPDGAFVVLVGPSGCGKSTLLRMIAGLEAASEGDIVIGERRVNDLEPRERDIAMVFQSYALYPHMNVRDNMSFNLAVRGRPAGEIKERTGAAAGVLGLDQLLERFPRQLSGGQRQRVAMGRAIVRQPQVFLFDEPLSNLDAKLRVQMRVEIRRLHQRLNATSIYVTHDQVEAMTMADRIVVLNRGIIEQVGAPLDLYDRPANLFVAEFIGSPAMNFLSGRVEPTGSGPQLRVGPAEALPLPAAARLGEGQPIIVGFRPEAARLGGPGPLAGRVSVVETLGPAAFVYVDVAGTNVCCQIDRASHIHDGSEIRLSVPPDSLHVFDPTTGARL